MSVDFYAAMLLDPGRSEMDRVRALRALDQLALRTQRARAVLALALRHESQLVRRGAAYSLLRIGRRARREWRDLLAAVRDPDAETAYNALRSLALQRVPGSRVLPMLAEALRSSSDVLRLRLLEVFCGYETRAMAKMVVPALRNAAREKRSDVSCAAAVCLGRWEALSRSELDLVARAATEVSPVFRRQACRILGKERRLSGSMCVLLTRIARYDIDGNVASEAARVFAKRGCPARKGANCNDM